MIPFELIRNEELKYTTKHKKLGDHAIIMNPPMQEESETSAAIYYGTYKDKPFIFKCVDKNKFEPRPELETMFMILTDNKGAVLDNPKNFYYRAPYCKDGNIVEAIGKGAGFNETLIKTFIIQICNQLHRLHKRNIYHGELSPEHIIVNSESSLWYNICGFGHYSVKSKEYYEDPIRLPYIDPRIVNDPNSEYDSSCDIYSLGALISMLLLGKDINSFTRVYQGTYLENLGKMKELSPYLNHLIAICTSPDPKNRPSAKSILFHPFFNQKFEELPYKMTKSPLGTGNLGPAYLVHPKSDTRLDYVAKLLGQIEKVGYRKGLVIIGQIAALMMAGNCPYMVKVTEALEFQSEVYLILEYCNGGNLELYYKHIRAKLKDDKNKPEEEKADYETEMFSLTQTMDVRAVAYKLVHSIKMIHEKGIIHKDIKTKSILVCLEEKTGRLKTIKLTDFGTPDVKVPQSIILPSNSEVNPEPPSEEQPEAPVGDERTLEMAADVLGYGKVLYYLAYLTQIKEPENINPENEADYFPAPKYPLPDNFVELMKGCLNPDPTLRLKVDDIMNHPYFMDNACVNIEKFPSCYEILEEEPMFESESYVMKKVVHIPTKTKFVMKIIKSTSPDLDIENMISDINKLIVLKESPNIYNIQQCFSFNEDYYFVLDYTEGKTLQTFIDDNREPSSRAIKKIVLAIVNAMVTTRYYGFTNNKIVPANLYIQREGKGYDEEPVVKVAGYSQIIQGLFGNPEVEDIADDIDELGDMIKSLIFGPTKVLDPNDQDMKDRVSTEGMKMAINLAEKCAKKVYTDPLQILEDKFFKE